MTRRALVTGARGFVGPILCAHLESEGWEVVRAVGPGENGGSELPCDIADAGQVNAMFAAAGSLTHVFHLAALSFVPTCNADPALAMRVNLGGTIHVAEAMQRLCPEARLLYIGSAAAYGPPTTSPITEEHPLSPRDPYAISKAAADHFCAYLHRAGALDVIRVRPFNHSGAGQSDSFVLSSFARQVAAIERASAPPVLSVGNLDSERDFSHVQDVVRAYALLAQKGHSGEAYNVASGKSIRIGEAIEALRELSTVPFEVQVAQDRLRTVDESGVYASCDKLQDDTGWKPERNLADLLGDLLEYWRKAG